MFECDSLKFQHRRDEVKMNQVSLPVSEAWFVFLWFSYVKELSAHPSYFLPTLIFIDQSH